MSQLATYNRIFTETFLVSEDKLPGFAYQDTPEWDSVGHMTMIAAVEEVFDIMMDTDDIIDFSSYENGIAVLKKYDVVI
ncbi:acyl carrier protein [Pectobacterium betavasculorum]|uniref:acyl carrier protein n=1 Tax=Pectobacterium betavasculorum TaxID=55207 RepID=UPI00313E59BD